MGADDMIPPAECIDFEKFLLQANVGTFLLEYKEIPVGYIQFVGRNSIMAEIHVAFLPPFRGKCAKEAIKFSLSKIFREKGILKVIANIAVDCRHTLRLASSLGFKREGRLARSILRNGQLRDIIIMGVEKDVWII